MTRLDATLNQPNAWQSMLVNSARRIEVDLEEVERVIELARRTPGLAAYDKGLRQLSIFFQGATQYYRNNEPGGLTALVEFWDRYRAAVIQRYAAVTPVELRAADTVVANIFSRFLKGVPNDRIAYSPDATPLVYGGEGGLGAYFTHPPAWNRPFAIISLPHTAFDHVWQWLALPHETGHDTYASINGLADELETALEERMRQAVGSGEIGVSDVDVDLSPFGVSHRIRYSGEDFLAGLWRVWANEAQADIVGLLSCGGAAAIALQQIVGFQSDDAWELYPTPNGFKDGPEVHPTSYVRNALNIAALRLVGDGHDELADELQARFESLRPPADFITWRLADTVEVARVPVQSMVRSAELAAEVLVSRKFASLGGKSYRDLADFTNADQVIVDTVADRLIIGDPSFSQIPGVTPRHALAATVFAFESSRLKAPVINRTFQHFL